MENVNYDVFISHASEDKDYVARPLAQLLEVRKLKVWLDENELTLGDSLRRKIDHGLASSRFGVLILSPAFFAKEWPQKELDALVSREDGREKVILPVWHKLTHEDVKRHSPLLADRLAVSTDKGLDFVAAEIDRAIHRSPPERVRDQDALGGLFRELLAARSESDVREVHYKFEPLPDHLRLSPQGRRLHHKILKAVAYEYKWYAPLKSLSSRSRLVAASLLLGLLTVLAGVAIYPWTRPSTPDRAKQLYAAADKASAEGRYDKALKDVVRAIDIYESLRPSDPVSTEFTEQLAECWLLRAQIRYDQEFREDTVKFSTEAIRYFHNLSYEPSNLALAFRVRAFAHFHLQRFEAAETDFTEAIRIFRLHTEGPENRGERSGLAESLSGRGETRVELKKLDEAITDLGEAITWYARVVFEDKMTEEERSLVRTRQLLENAKMARQ